MDTDDALAIGGITIIATVLLCSLAQLAKGLLCTSKTDLEQPLVQEV